MEIDLIDKKTSKLNSKQTFILTLLVLIGVLGYNIYDRGVTRTFDENMYATTELRNEKIINLLELAVTNKVNLLDEQGALAIYEKTFKTSRCEILDRVMHTLSVNHVQDTTRQVQLRIYYTTVIMNLYMDDKQLFNRYMFNNQRLDGIMSDIDPGDVSNEILRIMFSNRSTLQKRLDTRSYLHSKFNLFYQQAHEYIRENE